MDRCHRKEFDVLRQQPLFASLDDATLQEMAGRALCRPFPSGAILFREGQPCRGLYLVVCGAVRLYRARRDGREQVLQIAEAGESLGEASIFDGGAYLASARALQDTHALFLSLDDLRRVYAEHPEATFALIQDMGRRIRSLVRLVDRLSLQDVNVRVAGAVLEYGGRYGATREGGSFELPRTQEELAAELGTTREGVARALRQLRSRGLIRQAGSRVELLDVAALAEYAES